MCAYMGNTANAIRCVCLWIMVGGGHTAFGQFRSKSNKRPWRVPTHLMKRERKSSTNQPRTEWAPYWGKKIKEKNQDFVRASRVRELKSATMRRSIEKRPPSWWPNWRGIRFGTRESQIRATALLQLQKSVTTDELKSSTTSGRITAKGTD